MKTELNFDPELKYLAELFRDNGVTLYAVGGHVRNSLLGIPVSDTDITSALRPDEVLSLCVRNGIRVVPKGIAFGMSELHIGGKAYEHTTFRRDSYAEGGAHRPASVAYSDSPAEDAFRRDFTVNALYADILTGEISDPTGGLADLERGLIRTTSADPEEILRDDGLRLMRLCRFAAELGFDIEENTLAAAKNEARLIADVSAERVRDELKKLIMADAKYGKPYAESVLRGLRLLDETRVLDVILPELAACRGVEQSPRFHRYPVLEHIFRTTAMSRPHLPLRLACLFHDVAKPVMLEKNGNMHGHDAEGEAMTREILLRLRFDTSTADTVCWLVGHHMFDLDGTAKEPTLRRRFCRWGEERTLLLADIRDADFRGSVGEMIDVSSADRWRALLRRMREEGAPLSESELACTGRDIMEWLSLPPSPRVGEIKQALLMHCAVRPRDNEPEKLRRIARDFAKGASDRLPNSRK